MRYPLMRVLHGPFETRKSRDAMTITHLMRNCIYLYLLQVDYVYIKKEVRASKKTSSDKASKDRARGRRQEETRQVTASKDDQPISSRKRRQGALLRAWAKRSRKKRSDSPSKDENNVAPFAVTKARPVIEAAARTMLVLPHPGAPVSILSAVLVFLSYLPMGVSHPSSSSLDLSMASSMTSSDP